MSASSFYGICSQTLYHFYINGLQADSKEMFWLRAKLNQITVLFFVQMFHTNSVHSFYSADYLPAFMQILADYLNKTTETKVIEKDIRMFLDAFNITGRLKYALQFNFVLAFLFFSF